MRPRARHGATFASPRDVTIPPTRICARAVQAGRAPSRRRTGVNWSDEPRVPGSVPRMHRRLDSADAMLIVANVLWSINYATTKFAYRAWEPLAFSATRFLVAGVAFALVVLWREGSLRVRRADVPLVVGAAFVGILLNQLTFAYAIKNTTAGNVALILASAPAFAALFAMLAGHDHVRPRHWLALGISVAGVCLVVQGGAGVKGAGYL